MKLVGESLKCKEVVLLYGVASQHHDKVEKFENVDVGWMKDGSGESVMMIKKGRNMTLVRLRYLEGVELELAPEPKCARCQDGIIKIVFNDPSDTKAEPVEVPCPDCKPNEHAMAMRSRKGCCPGCDGFGWRLEAVTNKRVSCGVCGGTGKVKS